MKQFSYHQLAGALLNAGRIMVHSKDSRLVASSSGKCRFHQGPIKCRSHHSPLKCRSHQGPLKCRSHHSPLKCRSHPDPLKRLLIGCQSPFPMHPHAQDIFNALFILPRWPVPFPPFRHTRPNQCSFQTTVMTNLVRVFQSSSRDAVCL